MIREHEVDWLEALRMLGWEDCPDLLGKLLEEGKITARRVDGAVYLVREEIETLINREIEEQIGGAASEA